jgi:hypothetical protein
VPWPSLSPDGQALVFAAHLCRLNAHQKACFWEIRKLADVSVVRVSLATGQQALLHRWRAPGTCQVGANEGNFLLIGHQQAHGNNFRLVGWVDPEGFRALRYPRS